MVDDTYGIAMNAPEAYHFQAIRDALNVLEHAVPGNVAVVPEPDPVIKAAKAVKRAEEAFNRAIVDAEREPTPVRQRAERKAEKALAAARRKFATTPATSLEGIAEKVNTMRRDMTDGMTATSAQLARGVLADIRRLAKQCRC